MQEEGGDDHGDQDAAGQVQRHEVGLDAGFAEQVGEHQNHRLEGGADLREHPADHQQQADQHVGQPGAQGAHRLGGQLVELHFHAAQPLARPVLGIGEVPGALGYQEAEMGGGGDNGQTNQSAGQRGELGAEEHAGGGVGQGEGQAAEDGERQHFEAGLPALLLAEEAGQHQHHDQRHHGADDGVDDRHVAGDQLQECVPAGALLDQAGAERGGVQAAVDADDDRRADRTEGDRSALHQHAEHHRGQRREADGDQQRGGDGGGGAEAGGALDEAAEQPGDDDRLDAPVGADGGEAGADRGDAAGVLEGVEQQDGAEDDPQHADGDDQALHGGGEHPIEAHLPHVQADAGGEQVDQGHGALGGPAQADQQDGGEQDRGKRE
ncbi:hypothetical protein D3C81_1104360 [compost metagenome]